MSDAGARESGLSSHHAPTDGITLRDGEVVLANGYPSWSKWPKSLTLGSFFALIGGSSLAGGGFAGASGSLIVATGFFGYIWLVRRKSRYIVTNQRIKKHLGLVGRSAIETRISDIRSVATFQTITERLFGTGTVQVARNRVGLTLSIQGVRNHQRLADVISDQSTRSDSGGHTRRPR